MVADVLTAIGGAVALALLWAGVMEWSRRRGHDCAGAPGEEAGKPWCLGCRIRGHCPASAVRPGRDAGEPTRSVPPAGGRARAARQSTNAKGWLR